MPSSQKFIIATLSIIILILLVLVGTYGFQAYQTYATKPLGPALPTSYLPATWTSAPVTQIGMVTLVPTLVIPATKTPYPLCSGPNIMNIVAIGADSRSDNYQYGLGDAIRLVRVDFVTPKVTVLEFPRDLWVEIPYIADNIKGQDHEKLNQAYLYGQPGDGFHYWDDPSAGPGLLSLTLELNFGVHADHYAAVNMRTFEKIINAVGGIDINIKDKQMSRNTGLPMGNNHLEGSQALKVARNRQQGVMARASNQNIVMCALRKKLTNPTVVTKIPDLIDSFKDNILTDFTPQQLGQLACLGTRLPAQNIVFASFPEELFKQARIYDPVFKKEVFIWDVDFNILRDYVSRFQAGTWPEPKTAAPAAASQDTEVVCE